MSIPDWDTYVCKHCARLYGWLPAAIEYRQGIRKASLKYFTLCDVQAIDIFMFEKEGILARDANGRLPNVVICEEDPHKVPEIMQIVRPPIDEAIVNASLEDVLAFEDDEFTLTTPTNTWVRDRQKRRRLKTKQKYERLRLFFPFDIVNFDPYNSLLDPGMRENRIYRALERLFELQRTTDEFLLFLTTPLSRIHRDTEDTFREDLRCNISQHADIKEWLEASWGTIEYDKAEEMKRLALSIAKSIVIPAAQREGWSCVHKGIYIYENQSGHKMLDSVVLCSQRPTENSDPLYLDDILHIICDMPEYYSYAWSASNSEVKEHLNSIVTFREDLKANA